MLTLVENITLPMDLCGRFNPKQSRERALELLRLVEIEDHADKLPAHISGGQQQRVAIARALANDPPILVADEPTGSLDSVTAEHIFEVFEHLVSDLGKTIIMVTHDQSSCAALHTHAGDCGWRTCEPVLTGHWIRKRQRNERTSASPSRALISDKHAMSTPEAIIDMHGIVKTFKNAAGEFTALRGIDLTINRGEFVSIVGKSGSGKSTLLNMITGIDHPTQGRVVIGGTDIYTGVTESQRSRWRGRNLGIVFQFFQLLPMLTLLENVMLSMDFAEMYDFDERPERAMEMLKLVGIGKVCE